MKDSGEWDGNCGLRGCQACVGLKEVWILNLKPR